MRRVGRFGDSFGARRILQPGEIREQRTTAFGNIALLANAIGVPGDRTIAQSVDGIEEQLGGMQRVLFAVARAQGIDPDAPA